MDGLPILSFKDNMTNRKGKRNKNGSREQQKDVFSVSLSVCSQLMQFHTNL